MTITEKITFKVDMREFGLGYLIRNKEMDKCDYASFRNYVFAYFDEPITNEEIGDIKKLFASQYSKIFKSSNIQPSEFDFDMKYSKLPLELRQRMIQEHLRMLDEINAKPELSINDIIKAGYDERLNSSTVSDKDQPRNTFLVYYEGYKPQKTI